MESEKELTKICLDPDCTKQMIIREVGEFGSICIDRNSLEDTYDEDEFMNWLDENDLMIYCSYTICNKYDLGKEEHKEGEG